MSEEKTYLEKEFELEIDFISLLMVAMSARDKLRHVHPDSRWVKLWNKRIDRVHDWLVEQGFLMPDLEQIEEEVGGEKWRLGL